MAPDAETKPRLTQASRRAKSDRRLLAAAMRLVAQRGAASTSLAEIGLAAGYSRGLPAERYGTKLKLLEALVDEIDQWFADQLKRSLEGRSGLDALTTRIEAHLDGVINYPEGATALYHLFVESLSVIPELRQRIQVLEDSYRVGLRVHLEEGQRAGEIRQDIDTTHYATIILGSIRGVVLQVLMMDKLTELCWAKEELPSLYRRILAPMD